MRVLVLFAALLASSDGLDLAKRRASATSIPMRGETPECHYDRFKTPLRADLAPLCGNGRLDTIADYVAYPNKNASSGYFFYVNEVCDDGNRLDGDGCAADCASMDAPTTPCPLALDVNGEALRFLGFFNTSTLLVVTPTRALYVDPATLQPYASTPVVGVVSGYMAAPEAPDAPAQAWLYGPAGVWALGSSAPVLAAEASNIGIWAPTDNGNLLLVTNAGQVVDVTRARVMTAWASASESIAEARVWLNPVAGTMEIRCTFHGGKLRVFAYSPSAGSLVPGDVLDNEMGFKTLLDTPNTDPWIYLFVSVLMKSPMRGLSATSVAPRYSINDVGSITTENHIIQAMPFIIGGDRISPRDAFNENRHRTFILGDPLVNLDGVPLDSILCNGTDAPCLLDLPLCYDPLMPNPYSVKDHKDTLYTALVSAAVGASRWSEVPERTNIARGCTPGVATQALTHPVTGALWLVRGQLVFEVGRRGAQVPLGDGRCLPAYGGACPVGQWSTAVGGCIECALNVSLYNETTAWRQQCGAGAAGAKGAAAKGGRRMLAAPKQQSIRLILATNAMVRAGDAATALVRAVPGSVCTCMETDVGGTWRRAYHCILTEVRHPSEALRALRALVVPGVLDYLSPPSVVWADAAASSIVSTSEGPSVGVIVGATVAGVLGVVLLLGIFMWIMSARAAPRYSAITHQ